MTKTIDTGLTFTAIGKAIAERSGFAPVDMSIDLATVPQETLLRLARQGAVIFVSRLFAADKDAKMKESDYADAIANMFEAWKKGTEWRAKGEGKAKIQSTDWMGKATNTFVKVAMKDKKLDLADVEQFKAIRDKVLAVPALVERIKAMAQQLEAEHNAKQALLADIDLGFLDAKPKGKLKDIAQATAEVKVDF